MFNPFPTVNKIGPEAAKPPIAFAIFSSVSGFILFKVSLNFVKADFIVSKPLLTHPLTNENFEPTFSNVVPSNATTFFSFS